MSDYTEEERILAQEALGDEENRDNLIRPHLLEEFQGQSEVKDNLSVFISAARQRKDALDHVFISGPPGLGKTTLAGIMANELGVEFKVTSAPALDKPKDLAGLLSTIPDRTVFFIDEIHRLKPAIEEMLYIAMEDYALDWIIGQGPAARNIRIPIPPFTLIGATTKPGRVSSPLFTRFGINVRMNYYSTEELGQIVIRTAHLLDIPIEKDAALLLAKCSRGTPRIANRLVKRMRDYAQIDGDGIITADIVASGLTRLKIDGLGLEEIDREILRTIIKKYSGGPVGAETLAISVGEGIDSLEDFYEPYLIQMGFIKRTPRGRVATALAYEHLRIEMNEDQRFLF
ncbi:MAG: Holliday junction branch migration DNA helicase RuvB [Spirochaetales bacterium]|nr:Holliday junction branch migration DNA helicase RuvB [Spirochaetales bacterium]